jgi:hypothetical protein
VAAATATTAPAVTPASAASAPAASATATAEHAAELTVALVVVSRALAAAPLGVRLAHLQRCNALRLAHALQHEQR